MKIFRKITWETMKQNRTRTTVTIIGVILSATLFTAVTVFCGSLMSFLEKTYAYNSGNYHISAEGVDLETVQTCMQDGDTEVISVARELGYAEIGSENEDKPYLFVESADDTFYEEMPVHLTAGTLPQNENEILLPEHLFYNGGVSYEIGDTVTLQIGKRVIKADAKEELGQHNPYLGEEEALVEITEETFTVTGLYERPDFEDYSAPGYTALTRMSENEIASAPAGNGSGYNIYVLLNHPRQVMERYEQQYFYHAYVGYNSDLLMFAGIFSFGNLSLFFLGMVLFFVGLIFVGSVSLIYSAFSISVSERTKQFGLLASVGATKRQIRRMVWQESLIVSVIGIPVGIVVGIAGIGITLLLLGDRLDSLMDSPYRLSLSVSWQTIGLAAVIALFTVLVSALIPSARATRINAIDAIRQSRDVTTRGKDVKAGRVFYRLFGLEGMLGKKYFSRSRKKYRNTVISLAFSVVLFITASTYASYLSHSVSEGTDTGNYDLAYTGADSGDEIPAEELRSAAGVAEMAWSSSDYREVILTMDDTTDSYQQYRKQVEELIRNNPEGVYDPRPAEVGGQYAMPANIYYLDGVSYEGFVRQQGLDDSVYLQGGDVPAIVVNSGSSTIYTGDERHAYSFDYLTGSLNSVEAVAEPEEMEGYLALVRNWCRADTVENAEDETVISGEGQDGEEYIFCYQYVEGEDNREYDENGVIINARNIPVSTYAVELGDYVTEKPLGVPESENLTLIYPYHMLSEEEKAEYPPICYFVAADHDQMVDSVEEILTENGLLTTDDFFQDLLASEEDTRNLVTIINVFSYGFIILISLISVANVFNAISTNITLRRRDFAMLRSVGMTRKGMMRMLKFECLIYGGRSLAWGLPVGFVLGILLFRITGTIYSRSFQVYWQPYVIAVICVFAVVFVSMRYAMSRIKMENPIEALKEEN